MAGRQPDEYMVTFNGTDKMGTLVCRAQKIVRTTKKGTSEKMEFLSDKETTWQDGHLPLGTVLMVEKNVVVMD